VKFAKADVDEVHAELDDYIKGGGKMTKKIRHTVTHYDDVLDHAKKTVSLAENLELGNISICLGQESGSGGYFTWNDNATTLDPSRFTTIPVVGDLYWSAPMTNVNVDMALVTTTKKKGGTKDTGTVSLGCKEENCSAVVDTGTSLIVAPNGVWERLYELLDIWISEGGDCDDLSKFPDLEFELNGHAFSLPPDGYIGYIDGEEYDGLTKLFGNRKRKLLSGGCQPLIMSMDVMSDDGPMWILGMPFFRKYYTNFQFAKASNGRLKGSAMSFSVADKACMPSSPAGKGELLREGPSMPMPSRLRVDASKIRFPDFVYAATEAKARRQNSKLFRPTVGSII
jgi:hypothetical protein